MSNNKLYYRSHGIIANFAPSTCSDEEIKLALLRAIYMRDNISPEILALDVSEHIVAATSAVAASVRVIPTAILLASRSTLTFAATQAVLATHPQLSAALKTV